MDNLTEREKEIIKVIETENDPCQAILSISALLPNKPEMELPNKNDHIIMVRNSGKDEMHVFFEDMSLDDFICRYWRSLDGVKLNFDLNYYTWKYPVSRQYKYKNWAEIYEDLDLTSIDHYEKISDYRLNRLIYLAREITNKPTDNRRDYEKELIENLKEIQFELVNYQISYALKLLKTLIGKVEG